MSDDNHIRIRSYRNCFKLERRIHRIDRWRLPVPFGVPLRGIGYALASLLAILLLGQLPVLHQLLGLLPTVTRLGLLPIAIAVALMRWQVDGRAGHTLLRSWLRLKLTPCRLVAWQKADRPGQVRLGAVTIAPDDRGVRQRPAIIAGPASVVIRYPFVGSARGRQLRIRQTPGPPRWQGRAIKLSDGQRLHVR